MRTITWMGSWYLVPAYLLLILWFQLYKKRTRVSIEILSIAVTSTVVMFTLKEIFKGKAPGTPVTAVPLQFPAGIRFLRLPL